MEDCFIINTITDWSEPPRARHQVTMELSKKHKVVFVNANKVGLPGIKKNNEKQNLTIIYPSFPFNYKLRYRIPLINEIYQVWLFSKLKKDYPNFQMINFDFSASLIHRYFKIIYYCNDNFTRISKQINNYLIYKYHLICEEQVAKNAIFCVATSLLLKEKLGKINKNVFEIPLGGPNLKDYNLDVIWSKNGLSKSKIKVGLVGFIKKSSISAEIINTLVKRENIEMNIVGPIEPAFMAQLENKDKINFHGTKVEKELFETLNKMDVGIAPYHFGNLDLTPNKLFLYLALGKPTIVSNLNTINKEDFGQDIVYFAADKNEFVNAVFSAYERNSDELIKKRIEFAEKNSWEGRVALLLSIYQDYKGS